MSRRNKNRPRPDEVASTPRAGGSGAERRFDRVAPRLSGEERARLTAEIEAFADKLTPERVRRLREVVDVRMKGLCVVLECIYDAGNRSAVYRTAEGHGLVDVHVVRPDYATKPHARQVSKGAEKWLHRHEWDGATPCVHALRASGFQILAADLESARPLQAIDFSRPTALVFGNEKYGITQEMRDACDGGFLIPMRGFAQSFNISVAAAISVAHARVARERAIGARTDLDADESLQLLAEFVSKSPKWLGRVPEDQIERVAPPERG